MKCARYREEGSYLLEKKFCETNVIVFDDQILRTPLDTHKISSHAELEKLQVEISENIKKFDGVFILGLNRKY